MPQNGSSFSASRDTPEDMHASFALPEAWDGLMIQTQKPPATNATLVLAPTMTQTIRLQAVDDVEEADLLELQTKIADRSIKLCFPLRVQPPGLETWIG